MYFELLKQRHSVAFILVRCHVSSPAGYVNNSDLNFNFAKTISCTLLSSPVRSYVIHTPSLIFRYLLPTLYLECFIYGPLAACSSRVCF